MDKKRAYFPRTTGPQRRLLFETWEKTEKVTQSCQEAHVSRRTFYNWKGRFEAEGYEGLSSPRSRAPKNPPKIAKEVEEQVKKMHCEHPSWGKRRIADELAKGNDWKALVSPNTVKRILKDFGLWEMPEEKKGTKECRP